jgi:hypothetical protein
MNQVRRHQRVVFPSGISLPISSERGRAMNRLGGDERGSWGEYFAQGGDGEARRGRPERPGGGGDPGLPESSGRESVARGAGLGRLTDLDPRWVGLTEPVGLVGPAGPNGPRPFV